MRSLLNKRHTAETGTLYALALLIPGQTGAQQGKIVTLQFADVVFCLLPRQSCKNVSWWLLAFRMVTRNRLAECPGVTEARNMGLVGPNRACVDGVYAPVTLRRSM